MKRRILVVSPDVKLRAAAARNLQLAGYRVELAEGGDRSRALLAAGKIDAAIVQPSLLGPSDQKLLRKLKEATDHVIMLSNGSDQAEQLSRSLQGIVLLKLPVDWTQLLDRMAGLLAPVEVPVDDSRVPKMLSFEGRTVDLAGHMFFAPDGLEISLTRAEFQLLSIFIRTPGRVLSRDQLRNALVGRSSNSYDRSIDMLVARLRRKIESDPKAPHFILTVPGVGYKFAAQPQHAEPMTHGLRGEAPKISLARLQRRQVTVLACQLEGIGASAAKRDPEDLYDAKERVCQIATDIMEPLGGAMISAPGNRLLFCFGFPESREDDAERAVRAALELVHAVPNITIAPSGRLSLRAGIATGVVLVGGADAPQNHSVTGEPLNLAQHLQLAAPADGVVIAATTRELIGRFFDCEEIGLVTREEVFEPALAWRVTGESAAATSRFDALRRSGMIELIGREEQIELLLRRWREAQRGVGQVVVLTGEPGIGKSRLVTELERRIADEAQVLKYFGLPHQTDASMFALITELQNACRFERADTEPEKLRKLDAVLNTADADDTKRAAVIASLISLNSSAAQSIAQLSPQKRKTEIFAALLARIRGLAARQPLLVIVEDIHWIDPASVEFLSLLVECIMTLPILALVASRPGFSSPWPGHAHVTVVELPRLGRSEAKLLLDRVAASSILPDDVTTQILSLSEGVPLFVEELTKASLETSVLNEGRGQGTSDGGHSPAIPRTLHGSLLSRLDRLGGGRDIAQIGAVIGREFSYELLRAVTAMPEPILRSALDRLGASELVYHRGVPPLATYVFKHALIRDAAYGMLSRPRRNELHAAIANALEERFPEIVQMQPELLAHHHKEADNAEKAVGYLSISGERALSRSALVEAYTAITQALQLISSLPDDDSRRRQELKLRLALARTLLERNGYANKAVGEAYSDAHEFSRRVGDVRAGLAGLYGLWAHHYIRGEPDVMLKRANEFLSFAAGQDEKAGGQKEKGAIVVGHRLVGTSRLINGDIAGAIDALGKALGDYDPKEHGATSSTGRDLRARFGQDVGVTIYSYRSWALWLCGRPDQAAAVAKSTLDQALALKHDDQSLFYALWHAGLAYVLLRDETEVARLGDELTRHANSRGLRYWQALGNFLRGWYTTHSGRPAEAIELLQRGLELWGQTGARVFRPICMAFLAEAYAMGDRPKLARDTFEEALGIAASTGERWAEPEIRRLLGEALVRGRRRSLQAAIAQFEQAADLARLQGSLSLELRATMSLARLSSPNSQPEWHGRLSKIYQTFAEGFDTADLIDAKALLAPEAVP